MISYKGLIFKIKKNLQRADVFIFDPNSFPLICVGCPHALCPNLKGNYELGWLNM